MSRPIRVTKPADDDMEATLAFTLLTFGDKQHDAYAELIDAALNDIADDPFGPRSRSREELGDVRTFHIARRGRHARHLFAYRVCADGSIEVLRLFHDSMDLRCHLSSN